MRLYFTSREQVGSRLIRWATGGDVSHCAIAFGGSVYHSTEHGFLQQHITDFAKKYQIKRGLEFDIDDAKALQIFTAVVKADAGYDYSAFAFFAWCAFKNKFLNKPYPTKNPWNSNGYLCTETVGAADLISEILTGNSLLPDGIDMSITSPIQLCKLLEQKASKVIKCY